MQAHGEHTAALLRRLADPGARGREFNERLHAGWTSTHPHAWDGLGAVAIEEHPAPHEIAAHLVAHYAQNLTPAEHVERLAATGTAAEQRIGVVAAQRPSSASAGHIDNYDALQRYMEAHPYGVRTLVTPGARGMFGSLLDSVMAPVFGATIAALAPRVPEWILPERIPPAEMLKWVRLPHSFPVWVQWPLYRRRGDPVFGTGIATHFLYIKRRRPPGGILPFSNLFTGPAVPFLAVHELTPYGRVPGVEYQLGVWKIPLALTTMMSIAVMALYPAENIAVLATKTGVYFSVSYTQFMSSPNPMYKLAREALALQYPGVTGPGIQMRYLGEVPPEYAPFRQQPQVEEEEDQTAAEPATEEDQTATDAGP